MAGRLGADVSRGLRAELKSLVAMLANLRPRELAINPETSANAVLYANAFFLDGERRVKAGRGPDPKAAPGAGSRLAAVSAAGRGTSTYLSIDDKLRGKNLAQSLQALQVTRSHLFSPLVWSGRSGG